MEDFDLPAAIMPIISIIKGGGLTLVKAGEKFYFFDQIGGSILR